MDFYKQFSRLIFLILALVNNSNKANKPSVVEPNLSHETVNETINNQTREDLHNLVALFDKPLEPLVKSKANKQFVLPESYLNEEHRQDAFIGKRPNLSNVVVVQKVPLPNIDDILAIDRTAAFSLYVPKHKALAAKLINIFLGAANTKELLSLATYVHSRVNPALFIYAYSVALMHRFDTRGQKIPNHIQVHPEKYFNREVFARAREEMALRSPQLRKPIEIARDFTSSDFVLEHRLAYWREDVAVNLHHWHFHVAYAVLGNISIVNKDRRGELFYYMHRQILARYNFERFCNHLQTVKSFSNWNEPIEHAYFPKLYSIMGRNVYGSRPKNMKMSDVSNDEMRIYQHLSDLFLWRDRILTAIDLGYAKGENGQKIGLNVEHGTDILGNMIQSSVLSPNRRYYGDLHNGGHILMAFVQDPENHYHETMGVIGDTATAMRDPMFYPWHTYLDSMFRRYKSNLPEYTIEELDFPGITISNVNFSTIGEKSENVFITFWNKTDVNLIHGLNFAHPNGPVFVRYTHLDHRDFEYKITVRNNHSETKQGTCRIFLSPTSDERGEPWRDFFKQRESFIELDKFRVVLDPGESTIVRSSQASTVSVSFADTFFDFDKKSSENDENVYRGCGWPHHLLLPKGTVEGYSSQLLVMISDYEQDKVEGSSNSHNECYCGVKGSKYPDKRAMGYPFDRLPRFYGSTLKEFLTPNMFVQGCKIVHKNTVYDGNIS